MSRSLAQVRADKKYETAHSSTRGWHARARIETRCNRKYTCPKRLKQRAEAREDKQRKKERVESLRAFFQSRVTVESCDADSRGGILAGAAGGQTDSVTADELVAREAQIAQQQAAIAQQVAALEQREADVRRREASTHGAQQKSTRISRGQVAAAHHEQSTHSHTVSSRVTAASQPHVQPHLDHQSTSQPRHVATLHQLKMHALERPSNVLGQHPSSQMTQRRIQARLMFACSHTRD